MRLQPGTRLGPYEISAEVGAGGMGEVYRARDTRLERTVAVKIIPAHLAEQPDLRQRFEREARAISSLSHPHICHLYDVGSQDGIQYLVMEYLEGETLADRLTKGALPMDQVLRIGSEVADALDKAHRQGIVHRDLKPGNVMLTKAGAKLMDFGLAKGVATTMGAVVAAGMSPHPSKPGLGGPPTPSSPTTPLVALTGPASPLTQKGTIVGTFQYMAPEVLQGAEADVRSDIFSLGCVLYEMATGHRAFEGKSQISVLAAILEREPEPMSQLQPLTPPALEMLVGSCLAKDPDERLQTAHDLKLQLNWTSQAAAAAVVKPKTQAKWRERLAWAVAALAVMAAVAAVVGDWLQPTPKLIHAAIALPEKVLLDSLGDFGGPAVISPDGEKIAFSAHTPDHVKALWVRPMNSPTAQRLEGTDGAYFPFWSADGKYLGFFANGKLCKIAASGGPVTVLGEAPNGRGGSWGTENVIVYAPDFRSTLMRVSANGGKPEPATTLDVGKHTTHRWPWFLPDGKHFLYLAANHEGGVAGLNGIYFASLDGKENKLVVATDAGGQYASGYLLFHAQTSLVAQRFDPASGALKGDARSLVDRVQHDGSVWRSLFAASENGMLLYQTGSSTGGSQLTWFDRSGKRLGMVGERGEVRDQQISPDGKLVAACWGTPNPQVWVFDTARQVKTRLTFDATTKRMPTWSPDGKIIAYVSRGNGPDQALWKVAANGSDPPRVLLEEKGAGFSSPAFTPDGKALLYLSGHGPTGASIYKMPLDGSSKPALVVTPPNPQANIVSFRLSPNGRWIAYTSTESGQEVYVVPMSGGGRWQISSNSGSDPAWRSDGKELFYFTGEDDVYAVDVDEKDGSFISGQPRKLFHGDAQAVGSPFDTRDGKRFLLNVGNEEPSAMLNLVVNWTAELKK
jgi:serine/threonine protein kinase/Tol biopolymer transport system component